MIIPVTMTSLLSGKKHTRNYNMSPQQIALYTSPNRPNIQHIFPELSKADREFLISGITEAEWIATFGDGTEKEDEE